MEPGGQPPTQSAMDRVLLEVQLQRSKELERQPWPGGQSYSMQSDTELPFQPGFVSQLLGRFDQAQRSSAAAKTARLGNSAASETAPKTPAAMPTSPPSQATPALPPQPADEAAAKIPDQTVESLVSIPSDVSLPIKNIVQNVRSIFEANPRPHRPNSSGDGQLNRNDIKIMKRNEAAAIRTVKSDSPSILQRAKANYTQSKSQAHGSPDRCTDFPWHSKPTSNGNSALDKINLCRRTFSASQDSNDGAGDTGNLKMQLPMASPNVSKNFIRPSVDYVPQASPPRDPMRQSGPVRQISPDRPKDPMRQSGPIRQISPDRPKDPMRQSGPFRLVNVDVSNQDTSRAVTAVGKASPDRSNGQARQTLPSSSSTAISESRNSSRLSAGSAIQTLSRNSGIPGSKFSPRIVSNQSGAPPRTIESSIQPSADADRSKNSAVKQSVQLGRTTVSTNNNSAAPESLRQSTRPSTLGLTSVVSSERPRNRPQPSDQAKASAKQRPVRQSNAHSASGRQLASNSGLDRGGGNGQFRTWTSIALERQSAAAATAPSTAGVKRHISAAEKNEERPVKASDAHNIRVGPRRVPLSSTDLTDIRKAGKSWYFFSSASTTGVPVDIPDGVTGVPVGQAVRLQPSVEHRLFSLSGNGADRDATDPSGQPGWLAQSTVWDHIRSTEAHGGFDSRPDPQLAEEAQRLLAEAKAEAPLESTKASGVEVRRKKLAFASEASLEQTFVYESDLSILEQQPGLESVRKDSDNDVKDESASADLPVNSDRRLATDSSQHQQSMQTHLPSSSSDDFVWGAAGPAAPAAVLASAEENAKSPLISDPSESWSAANSTDLLF